MLRALAAISTVILSASVGMGATSSENVTIVKRPKIVYEDSSEHNRLDKSFYASFQPVGFAVGAIPSIGLNVGTYINSNALLQLEYSKGQLPYVFFDIEATTLGANLKYFFGNSFYTKGGATYRQVAVKNLTCILCSSSSPKGDVGSVDSIALEVAIGNQWQWQNFTLGCDWIGAMVPVVNTKVANNYSSDSSISASSKKDLDNAWNEVGRTTSIELLRFYLGASF